MLDLYAGSGALGLEALSRGADFATFVESDARAAAVIERNIATVGLGDARVLTRRVAAVLSEGIDTPVTAVDLVFADPPYDVGAAEVDTMLATLTAGGWTTAGTVVVVERPARAELLTWPDGWRLWPGRRYGDTRLAIAARD